MKNPQTLAEIITIASQLAAADNDAHGAPLMENIKTTMTRQR
jgi:hypothetical protein